jgi:hypothetical protein
MKRRIYVLLLTFGSLFLLNFSCQDHQIPFAPPELVTLQVTSPPSGIKCGTYFKVNVVNIGTMAVKEYGVVISAIGIGYLHPVPLVNIDYQLAFDSPFTTGEKAKVGPQVCTNNMYYRAYAILADDTVVYGNTLHFFNN